MRDAIHALKYDGLVPAARRLGHMLGRAIGNLAGEVPGGLLVIPVPLHRSKFAQRGFNQSRLLAVHAIAVLREIRPGWPLRLGSSTVLRQRATETQAGLTPRQRRKNVRGAFLVPNPQEVTGRNVLVIDDIMTTGATARSVAQVLLRAGASKVWIATLARARQTSDTGRTAGSRETRRDVQKPAGVGMEGGERLTGSRPEIDQPSF